jgi:hypothetical protein
MGIGGLSLRGLLCFREGSLAGIWCMMATIMRLMSRKVRSGVGSAEQVLSAIQGAVRPTAVGQLGEVRDGPLF